MVFKPRCKHKNSLFRGQKCLLLPVFVCGSRRRTAPTDRHVSTARALPNTAFVTRVSNSCQVDLKTRKTSYVKFYYVFHKLKGKL